ncbi:MAG: ClpXP protease specificity-enhancing factor [Pseudomonadota bacterium]
MADQGFSSRRPYLMRAMYEWMIDNDQTPYIVVDATLDGVTVPSQHVDDGKIILNISPRATDQLRIDNDFLSFSARFHGAVEQVFVPPAAVLGIYAKESGQGMIFTGEDGEPEPEPPTDKPTLRVVK